MWDVFKDWIFEAINFFYGLVGDWGLAIIIITVIFRILVAPLMHKQAKSNYKMQKIQPQIAKLQERLETERDRYIKQFTSLETLISQINNQSGWLSQFGGY